MRRVNADVVAFVVFFTLVGVLAWVYYPQKEPTDLRNPSLGLQNGP